MKNVERGSKFFRNLSRQMQYQNNNVFVKLDASNELHFNVHFNRALWIKMIIRMIDCSKMDFCFHAHIKGVSCRIEWKTEKGKTSVKIINLV